MAVVSDLAEFISGIVYDEIPGETIDEVKLHIIDTIGAIIAGEESELGRRAAGLFHAEAPQEATILIGGKRTDALSAAQINGGVAHCSEIDNIHPGAIVCLSGMVVPAALAWAEKKSLSGKKLMTAIAAGSEVGIRVGASVRGEDLLSKGWWPSSVFGPLGVCAAVAKLEDLTEGQTRHALSICSTVCGGLINGGAEGATARHFLSGWSVRCGAASAMAAKDGFTGPEDALEIAQGPFFARNAAPDFSGLLVNLGQEYRLSEIVFKSFASAMQSQSAVCGFINICAEQSLGADQIDQVIVELPAKALIVVKGDGVPGNHTTAAAHGKYLISAAMHDGDILPGQFDERKIFDPEITAFMKRVTVRENKELEKHTGKWPARIVVTLKNGAVFEKEVCDWMDGFGRREFVERKFARIMRSAGKQDKEKAIVSEVSALDGAENVSALIQAATV